MKQANTLTLSRHDFFVPHHSRVKANAGQLVALHVRECLLPRAAARQRLPGEDRVVLFVHGGNVPCVPAFDFAWRNYSWMGFLARAGFRTYALDLSGYGASPRPMMDDPANVDPDCQELLIPGILKAPVVPHWPFESHTIHSDWGEIDTVVDWLRRESGVRKVSLVGWSAGGPRAGGYMALHPDKVSRAVLFAPSPPQRGLRIARSPGPGAPTHLQTRRDLEEKRWDPNVVRAGQVEAGLRAALWKEIMAWDPIGANWGPGVMRSPNRTASGWTPGLAAKVRAPVLVITGEQDRPEERLRAHALLGSRAKAFLRVASASHFMAWEHQRHVLHRASLEWLATGHLQGSKQGGFHADWAGRITRL